MDKAIFAHTIPAGTVEFIPVPIRNHAIGAHLAWRTGRATIALEVSSDPSAGETPDLAGDPSQWEDTTLYIPGPAGVPGCKTLNLDNVRQRFARLRVTAADDTVLVVWDGEDNGL